MFHYAETALSTGEPPTDSSEMSSQQETGPVFPQGQDSKHQPKKTDRDVSNLIPQEADSGYEASPSSTNDVCTFSFEGSRNDSNVTSDESSSVSMVESTGEDYEDFDSSSPILMYPSEDDESESSEEDLADNGNSGGDAEDTLLTRRWPGESLSIHVNSPPDAEGDQGRPSSLPIPIPLRDDPGRLHATFPRDFRAAERLYSHSLPSPVSISAIPSPVASPQMPHMRIYLRLPFSWPFVYSSARPDLLPTGRRTTPDTDSAIDNRSNRPTRSTWTRSRRRLIDSDASSISSSEAEGPEEVFDDISAHPSPLEEIVPLVSSAPSPDGHLLLLPDVVPYSSSIGNSNGVRRSRSISVNLPLDRHQEETVVEIGRTLRRLSDQFANEIRLRRSAPNRRRYTISEMVRLTLHTLDHRPPRADSDDDSDGRPMVNHVRRS